jgi:hypothetical protein
MPARQTLVRADGVEIVVGLETWQEGDRFVRLHNEVRCGVVDDVIVHQEEARAPALVVELFIIADPYVFTLERHRVGFGGIGVDINVATQAKRQLILRLEREVAGVVAVEPQYWIRHRLPGHVPSLKQNIATTTDRPGFHEAFPCQEQSFLYNRDTAERDVVSGNNTDVASLFAILRVGVKTQAVGHSFLHFAFLGQAKAERIAAD